VPPHNEARTIVKALVALYYHATLHHQLYLAQGLYLLGRVASYGYEVGEQAGCEAATVGEVEDTGVAASGGA
jgi:hypothetical protein